MSPPDAPGYDKKGHWCGSVEEEIAHWKARAEKAEKRAELLRQRLFEVCIERTIEDNKELFAKLAAL